LELRFVSPQLAELDRVGTEVLVAGVFSDERPPHGVPGLVDWRGAGRLSRLMLSGFLTGELGEILMLPGKPSLPFDKLILFGAGRAGEFDDEIFRGLVERMLFTMEGLRTRTVVAQLPGRHLDVIPPERAADILLETAADKPEHDVWTLVETTASQRAITEHLIKKRRRRG
jgi:hypothetical protein